MLKGNSFLAVDFGAGSLKLAEFEVNEAGGLVLKHYAIKPLGLEGSQETKREALILKTLQEALAEKGIKAKDVNVCAPGFHVFSKFVKLPPVDASKVTQIIQYEAQQNVPFPLAEVVWDYQIIGTTASGELEVLLVAIKADIVEGLFRTTAAAGLRLQICDVSPAALCNTFRYNYGELEDCTMLLDIGAKTSNLLFFEKGKVFSRSINLGANSITQDFANEAKLKFDAADKIKIAEGFVSLGGAYEEPENQHQAAISKIARQFMTRLHIQVNQTMQFYRGQQGGSAPQRLYLSGGAAIMPYTAQFFAEKLNVPVEYLNPFRSVQIDPGVNLEELARVAHSLGEVVGLGLRNLVNCPVELNLMPESTLRWQSFNARKPYFLATLGSLVLMALAVGFLFEQLAEVKRVQLERLEPTIAGLQGKESSFKKVYAGLKRTQGDLEQVSLWLEERYFWAAVVGELRGALLRAEDVTGRKFGHVTGVWIESLSSLGPLGGGGGGAEAYIPIGGAGLSSPGVRGGAEEDGGRARMARGEGGDAGLGRPSVGGGVGVGANTNEVGTVTLVCRGVSLTQVLAAGNAASANTEMAFAVEAALKECGLFVGKETQLTQKVAEEEGTGTFTFGLTLKLKRPLKL